MKRSKPIKILMAKVGLDGHDRGAKVLTLGLRDRGFEVIFTGVHQTPEKIVQVAIQEDVDVIGLSCLSGAHNHLFPRVTELLKQKGVEGVLVLGGGIIPTEDIPFLNQKGISAVFGPGTPIAQVADYIEENARR